MHPTDIATDMYVPPCAVDRKHLDTSNEITGLSIRQNFSWNLVGNIVYAGCQWGMLVALAKWTNTEMVGRFALGLAITAPIILMSQLQLRGIQATDAKDEFEFGHYMALRLLTTVLALVIMAGVAIGGGYSLETALVITAVGLSKSFESISDVYYGLMQRHERMDRIARSRLLKGPLSLVAFCNLVYLTHDVFWGVIGYSAVWGLLLLIYDFRMANTTLSESRAVCTNHQFKYKPIMPIFNRRKLLCLSRLALPLGMVMALLSLNINIPRYFIESHGGEAGLGIFAALAYLIIPGSTIVSAIGESVVPRLAIYFANGKIRYCRQLMIRFLAIGLLLGMAGFLSAIVLGNPMLSLLYGPEYANHLPVLVWLMVAGGLMYVASILGYGMTAARRFKAQVPLFVAVALTIYASSLWLIPKYTLSGAAFSLIAGALIQILGSGVILILAFRKLKNEAYRA